jgi:hypothetical protein
MSAFCPYEVRSPSAFEPYSIRPSQSVRPFLLVFFSTSAFAPFLYIWYLPFCLLSVRIKYASFPCTLSVRHRNQLAVRFMFAIDPPLDHEPFWELSVRMMYAFYMLPVSV